MASTFDETELLDRVDNDVGFLAETVEMLTSDGPPLIRQIRQAVEAGDAPGVARHAHALKGMLANFCAAGARGCAADLERMGREGNLQPAAPALSTLEGHVNALSHELLLFIRARA